MPHHEAETGNRIDRGRASSFAGGTKISITKPDLFLPSFSYAAFARWGEVAVLSRGFSTWRLRFESLISASLLFKLFPRALKVFQLFQTSRSVSDVCECCPYGANEEQIYGTGGLISRKSSRAEVISCPPSQYVSRGTWDHVFHTTQKPSMTQMSLYSSPSVISFHHQLTLIGFGNEEVIFLRNSNSRQAALSCVNGLKLIKRFLFVSPFTCLLLSVFFFMEW
jgi:hypothetical protein